MLPLSLFEIINAVIPNKKNIFSIAASVAYIATVSINGIKTLLDNCLTAFFIKGKPVFNNRSRNLPKNPLDCIISGNGVFDDFILPDEPFPKALRSLETCVLVNNNLGEK